MAPESWRDRPAVCCVGGGWLVGWVVGWFAKNLGAFASLVFWSDEVVAKFIWVVSHTFFPDLSLLWQVVTPSFSSIRPVLTVKITVV